MTVHLLRLLTTAPTPASRAVTVAARCEEERGEDLGGGEEDWGGQCPLVRRIFVFLHVCFFLFGSASDHQNRRTVGDDIDERHLQIYFVCAFCLSEIIAVSKTKDTPIWLQILLWGSVERVVWGLR